MGIAGPLGRRGRVAGNRVRPRSLVGLGGLLATRKVPYSKRQAMLDPTKDRGTRFSGTRVAAPGTVTVPGTDATAAAGVWVLYRDLVRGRHRVRWPCPESVAVSVPDAATAPDGVAVPVAGPSGPPVAMLPMVRWASCPPCGRLSERWWSMRGLEAHATMNPSQP
jgi:hypothetical protein